MIVLPQEHVSHRMLKAEQRIECAAQIARQPQPVGDAVEVAAELGEHATHGGERASPLRASQRVRVGALCVEALEACLQRAALVNEDLPGEFHQRAPSREEWARGIQYLARRCCYLVADI